MIEPLEIRIARPEIALVNVVVMVGADPQFLIADPRLDVVKARDHAGLKNVVPGGGVKAGYLDAPTKIVLRAECIRRRVSQYLIEKRLPC